MYGHNPPFDKLRVFITKEKVADQIQIYSCREF